MNLKSGGLHEKLAVATSNLGTISAFAWRQRKTKKKTVSRWPLAGPSGCILTTSQQSDKQKLQNSPGLSPWCQQNTHILRARLPRVNSTSAPFTTGLPGHHFQNVRSAQLLSGCPAIMSGLTMVTDALVSMVIRNGFSCIQPSAIRLSSVP
jgi:hypothetical protein